MADNSADVVTPPNLLKTKAGQPQDKIDRAAIEKAGQAVEGLKDQFTDELLQDIKKLNQAFKDFTDGFPFDDPAQTDLYNLSFEVKGMAGTFGYSVIGGVCASLCDLLDKCDQQHAQFIQALNAHIYAIQAAVKEQKIDENSKIVQELLGGLAQIVEKISQEN